MLRSQRPWVRLPHCALGKQSDRFGIFLSRSGSFGSSRGGCTDSRGSLMSPLKPIFLLVLLFLFVVCAHSPTQTTAPTPARAQEEESVIQVANEDVVSGKLSVKVFAHGIEHRNEHIRCWTYTTAGLSALGQPELL